MHLYNASALFTIETIGNFPLNINFQSILIPQELNGTGIYLMFLDQLLVYCGIAEKEQAIVRFEKQLSTISLRGVNVSFNEIGKTVIQKSFLLPIYSSALQQNEWGFETSIKRINFAEKNWQSFRDFDNKTLERFVFIWMPSNKNLNEQKIEILKKLKPLCNR